MDYLETTLLKNKNTIIINFLLENNNRVVEYGELEFYGYRILNVGN